MSTFRERMQAGWQHALRQLEKRDIPTNQDADLIARQHERCGGDSPTITAPLPGTFDLHNEDFDESEQPS